MCFEFAVFNTWEEAMKKPDALESMKQAVAKGRMSRREFVQLALAAGVTVTAAQGMFVTHHHR